MDRQVEERRAKLNKHGCFLQPFIIAVGPTLKNINQLFVYLYNDYRYEVESILSAVDTTFKCIFALDMAYPPEADQIWQFLQKAVYGIIDKRKGDRKSLGKVETLVGEYKKFL